MPGRKSVSKPSRGSSVTAKKKTVKEAQEKLDSNFISSLSGNATEKDIEKLFTLAVNSATKEDINMMQTICEAITRMCDSDAGFFLLFRCNALDNLTNIAPHIEGAKLDIQLAFHAIIRAASRWLDEMDHVDFFRLPHVLDLALKLAAEHKVVALSAVATLDRFAMQLPVHRVTILKGGGLHLLHQILATHRSPEFCQETMTLIYHICDVPKDVIKPFFLEELSLIKTVVETLDEAPVNMRLQFTGLRLIALWLNLEGPKIQKAFHDARAQETLREALDNLRKGGFSQSFAWLEGIASVAFACNSKVKKHGKAQSVASSGGRTNEDA